MIDVSLCPNPHVKNKTRLYYNVVAWLGTLAAMRPDQDASGGKLKAALTSSTPLFVTSYQYQIGNNQFTCINVMVDRQDYRVIIGYDDKIIRVETLDARAARAQTREEADRWAGSPAAAAAVSAAAGADQPAHDYIFVDQALPIGAPASPYANNPASLHPYGVPIAAPE